MIAIHPYIRYAQALIMVENDLNRCEEITVKHIIAEIVNGLNSFRIYPIEPIEGKSKVKFGFIKLEKGDTKQGIFFSPNIISSFKESRHIWNKSHYLLEELPKNLLDKLEDVSTSIAPVTGEYLSFSLNKKIGRGNPKITLKDQGLSAITTLSPIKPCLQYRIDKKGKPDMYNVCIIPDIPLDELKSFIQVFKRLRSSGTDGDLMVGNVLSKPTGKGKTEKITYEAKPPLIFKGNFPNPPRSSALGSIALLGAIGELAKEAQDSEQVKSVLESLKNSTIYLVKYGNATSFTYNHHVIDLAKAGKLKTIVDSIYYSELALHGKRNRKDLKPQEKNALVSEYQKFDLFTSRFLQLFNHAAFKDFLAFRAEYPNPVTILFNTYFIKMEKIDSEIVKSARTLGKWLNMVAFLAAKSEIGKANVEKLDKEDWIKLKPIKSKVLIELESSTFSAKSGDALIAQAVTRAGRLSGLDAPEAAALFMEKTSSGELPLENAKNLLIAFSRLINKAEKKEVPIEYSNDDSDETESDDQSEE
jgi:CRISPR-associated protein Cas8c/Csp2